MKRFICLALLALLTACSERIVIYHQFIKDEDIASVRMKTPDPNPTSLGERLVIMWGTPAEYDAAPKKLILWVRYNNGGGEKEVFSLEGRSGLCQWQVRGPRHKETGGVASYRAELYAGEELLEEWRHLVWVERIEPATPLQTQIAVESSS